VDKSLRLYVSFVISSVVLLFLAACGGNTDPTSVPPPAVTPLLAKSYYLSDLRWESATNTYGPFEKDSSNGGKDGGDGRTLMINGKTYAKGLGVTSPSEIVFKLGGVCSVFSAEVGVDDLWNATRGSVVFQVFADTIKIWDSGLMIYTDPFRTTGLLNVTGTQLLKLVTTDGGNGGQDDFADWAIPTITCDPAPSALAPSDAGVKGMFGPVEPWATVATHATLLPDSSIISWYSRDTIGTTRDADYNDQAKHNSTLVDLWNLNTNSHSRRDNTTTDLFCSGFTLIADGRLLVSGGNLGSSNQYYPGSVHTNLFSPATKTWTRGPDMSEGRWYPSVINLPNKEVLFIAGNSNEITRRNYIPDVWNPGTNTLRRLTGASTQARNFYHLYPWVHVAPNGQVFYSGAVPQMAYLNTSGTGSWGTTYTRDTLERRAGSSVMYEPGKILVVGGGVTTTTNTAVTVNLTNGVQTTATASMSYSRKNLNATLLPDGTFFVNGGNSSGINFDDTTSVYVSEIWNPATGTWRLGASAQKPRNYHSVALLLPDGRVWTAGGGGCGATCTVNQQSAEMYYPPYLFKKTALVYLQIVRV
jgi:NPCBM/NEW2 domain/Glyoxal oxidase N-terminus